MLAQTRQTRTRVSQICDGALFALALAGAYCLRDGLARFEALGLSPLEPFSDMLWTLPASGVLGAVFLRARGFYSLRAQRRPGFFAAFVAAALTAFALIVMLFLLREQVARSVILLGCALGGALACARAALAARLSASRLANEQWRERVLWLGDAESNRRHRAGLSPDELAHAADCGDFDPAGRPVAEFAAVLHERAVNTVIFSEGAPGTHREFLDCCMREGVSVVVRTGVATGAELDSLGGEAVIHCRGARRASAGDLAAKRVCDVVLSITGLVVFLPVLLAVALVVKCTSRGPVLFRQVRAGLNGRAFTMLKFRTMRAGAENEQPALAAHNEMRGPVFKMADDPRLTAPGRFLRRHALDELPQLWNVLRGEMSIVGPRPLPDYETARFDDDAHRRRQSMRPGLTCLWQVKGRNDIVDFEEWVRLDLAYIDNWSLWLDARIMLATVPAVILGRGGR